MNKNQARIARFITIAAAICLPAFAAFAPPPTVTPEPATMGLIGGGLAAVIGLRYYRSRKR